MKLTEKERIMLRGLIRTYIIEQPQHVAEYDRKLAEKLYNKLK